ncbi:hypothetical protein D3C84_1139310 [compost metagenome]
MTTLPSLNSFLRTERTPLPVISMCARAGMNTGKPAKLPTMFQMLAASLAMSTLATTRQPAGLRIRVSG